MKKTITAFILSFSAIVIFSIPSNRCSAQSFNLLWSQTNTPSIWDEAIAITADASGIYAVGGDQIPGDIQWCIEKRNLNTGAIIWTQTNNPNGNGEFAYAIASDAGGIYIAGEDRSPGNRQWRIEKRNVNTGAIIWQQTSNPTSNDDFAYDIAIDASGIYVVGLSYIIGPNVDWRIEKRDLNTGNIIWTQLSAPTASADWCYGVAIDASGIYVVGSERVPNDQWRIEKRDLSTGALITSFGTGGVINSNPSAQNTEWASKVAVDASGMYIIGRSRISGNDEWHIEKRDLSTGALLWSQTNNISSQWDVPSDITINACAIYIAGVDYSSGNYDWRIEKRDLNTGALLCLWTNNYGTFEGPVGMTLDASGIYVAGYDDSPAPGTGDGQWRIHKYDFCGTCSVVNVNVAGASVCQGECATLNATPNGGTSPYTYAWMPGGQTTSFITVCPTATATYSVLITDSASSTAADTAIVNVSSGTNII